MSLLELERISVGQVGLKPGSVKMVSTANLMTITTAGYLNGIGNQIVPSVQLAPSDVIECLYNYNPITDSGTLAYFQPSISHGEITLVQVSSGGSGTVTVTGSPPVVGDFAAFSGATSIADTGYFPSSNANAIVSTISTLVTSEHFAVYKDNNGSIGDNGYVPSDASQTTVVMTNGNPIRIANIAVFTDTVGTVGLNPMATSSVGYQEGTIYSGNKSTGVAGGFIAYPNAANLGSFQLKALPNGGDFDVLIRNLSHSQATSYDIPDCSDSSGNLLCKNSTPFTVGNLISTSVSDGVVVDSGLAVSSVQSSANIKAAQTSDIGGAGAGPIFVSAPGLQSTSIVVATVLSSSNPVSVIACVPSLGNFSITFSADPGASCFVNWIAFVAPQ